MSNVETFLLKAFCEVCEIDPNDFGIDFPLDECEEWDSLNMLSFLSEIEDEYGITISADDVEALKTIKDFADHINKGV